MADFKSLDSTFSQAVAAKKIPGIVAMATTDKGVLYEGAFGQREIGKPAPMTTDTVVWIASMTKAITGAAAMQLVERGKLSLERPAAEVVPELGAARVLEGFDAAGKPRLRAPKRPMTLRHLLTHTAGFSYEIWSPDIARFQEATGTPGHHHLHERGARHPAPVRSGRQVGLRHQHRLGRQDGRGGERPAARPLPPGQHPRAARHEGHLVQALGLAAARGSPRCTAADPTAPSPRSSSASRRSRSSTWAAAASTAPSPTTSQFCRMIMNGGTHNGAQVLQKSTVDLMAQNHIGDLEIGALKTAAPPLSNDVELFPGMSKKWGLSFLINTKAVPGGRSANSLAWAGLANTYFWIDRTKRVSGVFASQLLPFYDDTAIDLLGQFETSVYRNV